MFESEVVPLPLSIKICVAFSSCNSSMLKVTWATVMGGVGSTRSINIPWASLTHKQQKQLKEDTIWRLKLAQKHRKCFHKICTLQTPYIYIYTWLFYQYASVNCSWSTFWLSSFHQGTDALYHCDALNTSASYAGLVRLQGKTMAALNAVSKVASLKRLFKKRRKKSPFINQLKKRGKSILYSVPVKKDLWCFLAQELLYGTLTALLYVWGILTTQSQTKRATALNSKCHTVQQTLWHYCNRSMKRAGIP